MTNTENMDKLKIAQDVLDDEISGLELLKSSLGDGFVPVLDILAQAQGRIIVTGMGKSGHIARKIAATFASTGTPASYVHPAEASHGDLGMITRDDVILALSKSGETAEMGDILGYASRFSIPVTAITSGKNSSLTHSAKASFILPNLKEACEITNAPTTSTTMMMAIGDAFAVSLMRLKGVTAHDFHGFHPGGMLGATLRRVGELMTKTSLPLCHELISAREAVKTLSKGGFGCVGLINDDGILTGIITDGDVRRHFGEDLKGQMAKDIMTATPKTALADTLAGDALAIMNEEKITSLFILNNQKPIGLLHIHDCLAAGVV